MGMVPAGEGLPGGQPARVGGQACFVPIILGLLCAKDWQSVFLVPLWSQAAGATSPDDGGPLGARAVSSVRCKFEPVHFLKEVLRQQRHRETPALREIIGRHCCKKKRILGRQVTSGSPRLNPWHLQVKRLKWKVM